MIFRDSASPSNLQDVPGIEARGSSMRALALRFALAATAAASMERINTWLGGFTVVALEPLPALAFLTGALFGWTGVIACLLGQITYRCGFLSLPWPEMTSTEIWSCARVPLAYLPIGLCGHLTFRSAEGLGRGFPNARSYAALVGSAFLGGLATALLFDLPPGAVLVHSASNFASVLLVAPPVLLLADRFLRPWMAEIRGEARLPKPFPANLAIGDQTGDMTGRLLLILCAMLLVTGLVVPLAQRIPLVGGWPLLGYLGLVVWASLGHGLRGGLFVTSLSGIFYLAGRSFIDRDFLPDDPALYAAGLYADFVVFSVVAVVLGSGREGELALLRERADGEHRATILNEMADLLQASLDREEVCEIVLRFAQRLFPDESGALCLLSPASGSLQAKVRWGDPGTSSPFSTEDCWSLRRGRPHFRDVSSRIHPAQSPPCPHLSEVGGSTTFCVPLIAQGETLGVFYLEDGAGRLQPAKRHLAVAASRQIALALANLDLRHSLLEQSIRDPLTGLFNRRYLNETLHRERIRAIRQGSSFVILLADIDHFKRFNDTHGHIAGDVVLCALASFLKEQSRGEDIVCRWGGEEFIWVQLGSDLDAGLRRAEEICRGVRELELSHEGRDLGTISLSIGVAAYPHHGSTEDCVIQAADAALYRAKEQGRNRVVCAEGPPPRPNLQAL